MKDRLADAIARLPEREKLVVALYYYENLTLREIGEVLGVTESRVSQLHTKAVLRLKSRLQGDPLADGRLSRARRVVCSAKLEERRRGGARIAEEDPQRGLGGPPRQREDVRERGAPVHGRRDQPAGLGGGRNHGLGLRARREGARDVDLREPLLVSLGRPQDQPDRHARRAELRGRRPGRSARMRGRRVRGQRRDGRGGDHQPALGARRRARARARCSS